MGKQGFFTEALVLKGQKRLTQRAADGGYTPCFWSMFLALGCSRFGGESTLPPTAANASRWATM